MDDETYLDTPYLSIRWRPIPKVLYAEWRGFATSAEFRAALLTGVRAMRERHIDGYVSDARKAKVVLPEDEIWAMQVWLPQAVAAGLKRMAVVIAPTGLARQTFEKGRHPDRQPWHVDADVSFARTGDGLGPERSRREPPNGSHQKDRLRRRTRSHHS